MSLAILIPARYNSSRFPGKALAPIAGAGGVRKPLVQRTWESALAVGADEVFILTDDERIQEAAKGFGASVLMTSPSCENGTARCAEALGQISPEIDCIVNLQGDAPLTPPQFIRALVDKLEDAHSSVAMATPVLRLGGRALGQFRKVRESGKVGGTTAVFDQGMRALYFSKEIIPHVGAGAGASSPVFQHLGVYAYNPEALSRYTRWIPGPLETSEGLEQLRFIENGETVLCVEVESETMDFPEVNNPEDVRRVERVYVKRGAS